MQTVRFVSLAGFLLMVALSLRADVKNAWVGVNGAT